MSAGKPFHRAFGLTVDFGGLRAPGRWRAGGPAADLTLVAASDSDVKPPADAVVVDGWRGRVEGSPFVAEVLSTGELAVRHATGDHLLSADGALLHSGPVRGPETSWWRVLLDPVLSTVALQRGYEAVHAGAVAVSGRAVAITAPSGGGKSTLVAELVARGHELVTDDVLVLDGELAAQPGAPVMTVPAACEHGGEVIAELDGERWIAAPVVAGPLPLGALVVLERQPGAPTALEPLTDPLPALLGSLLSFPKAAERELARFELAARLTAELPLLRLRADVDVPPAELAAAVESIGVVA